MSNQQQTQLSLRCSDCNTEFNSAALLLKHFAQHASAVIDEEQDNDSEETQGSDNTDADLSTTPTRKTAVPDLYPIADMKTLRNIEVDLQSRLEKCVSELVYHTENADCSSEIIEETDTEDFDPVNLCLATLDESKSDSKAAQKNHSKKKYQCSFCQRSFGWSTDLKRHLLTHTGERPFKCELCDANFTRNFLLQKHQVRSHPDFNPWKSPGPNKVKIPNLRPIREPRKQNKTNIRRKLKTDLDNEQEMFTPGLLSGPMVKITIK